MRAWFRANENCPKQVERRAPGQESEGSKWSAAARARAECHQSVAALVSEGSRGGTVVLVAAQGCGW
jgi:hypothetical protein